MPFETGLKHAKENLIYEERVRSGRTEKLFLLLTALFFALFAVRRAAGNADALAAVFFGLFVLFLFYSLNYRTLIIRVTENGLALHFGVFKWRIPHGNICSCRLDDRLCALKKYGGAGIHFFFADRRYRASFNFLEHPRVVVELKRKAWVVEDVSFTSRRPEVVIRLIRDALVKQSGDAAA